jgi:hypothetical protein
MKEILLFLTLFIISTDGDNVPNGNVRCDHGIPVPNFDVVKVRK